MKKLALYILSKPIFRFTLFCFLCCSSLNAQNKELLLGHWELDRISLANKKFEAFSGDEDELKTLFRTVVLQKLVKEEPVIHIELEAINKQVEELASFYNQSVLEIKSQAISNRAKTELSGEYLLKDKVLMIEWSNAEKNNLKIIKLNKNELVFRDLEPNLVFYYFKLVQE
ncbi:hypothetical protein FLGE108171_09675 [Flavobacterium gelidilacus]|jgi:hypothetical protein|uniref:hypothetical protein n=1 Tax=Flavobacterium gelidilacus TaxID=206041 RepID=UPI00041BDCD6|nr:hypothetical protein [Flavobacterium gelidilacus]